MNGMREYMPRSGGTDMAGFFIKRIYTLTSIDSCDGLTPVEWRDLVSVEVCQDSKGEQVIGTIVDGKLSVDVSQGFSAEELGDIADVVRKS